MPHIHEQIDFTIAAYIVHQEKVLFIHHNQLNMWLPIGGHIELDEDPEEALYREIKEESGLGLEDLEITSKKPEIISEGTKFLPAPNYLDIHQISGTHRHIGMVYFLRSLSDQVKLAPEEHGDIRWFSRDDLADKKFSLTKGVSFYAERALDLLTS